MTSLGYSLAAPPGGVRPMHFQKLVEKIKGAPEERPIAFLMLRTMQKARYDSINVGHFGLAAPTYTHFTSPIRRYPDLVVHRLLREVRHTRVSEERKEDLADDLPDIGRHTSDMERRADEAERELVQWKKVRFMADKVGDVFDGYITGVAAFGLFVELVGSLRRRARPRVDDGGRLLPLQRAGAHAVRREHEEDSIGSATASRCRSCESTSSSAASIWASRMCSPPFAATNGAVARHGARRARRRISGRARRKIGARSSKRRSGRRHSARGAESGRPKNAARARL